jgi:hypothetical protein
MNRWYAGVGSRETPQDVWDLMYKIGYYMAFSGWGLSSGGAVKKPDAPPGTDSADDAFLRGALACPQLNPVTMLRIYLINAHWEFYKPDPARGFYDSRSFTETWDRAMEIAKGVRGSWEGLKENGIALHTRNVFQELGHDLVTPVRETICWAQPVGKQGQVKGGTNTAVKLALARNIPVMNLYLDDARERAEQFVQRAEQRYGDLLCIG